MNILCISRGILYSPNLVENDAAIFMAVVDELRAMGHEVTTIYEDKMAEMDFDRFDRVMTMARNEENINAVLEDFMEEWEDKFINSLEGSLTCMKKAMVALQLVKLNIPQPTFKCGHRDLVYFETTAPDEDIAMPAWLKNSDGTAQIPEDTLFCPTNKDYLEAKKIFKKMGVETWLLQEHKEGDLVKFYGVEGTDFFHWQYASHGHSKFGLENINGKEKGYAFDAKQMKDYANQLAGYMHVPVYGGDAVIDKEGQIWFIDFNDFPSFSSCMEEAAKAIAKRVVL